MKTVPYTISRTGGEVMEGEHEEAVAFTVAREMLENAFSGVFSDDEFVREREEIVRMCPWGSSELINVEELLWSFSWYKGPAKLVAHKTPTPGLRVTWTERETTPETSPRRRPERKMKIGLDVTSD